MKTTIFMGQFTVYYWQSLRYVSRYIIPETGYMMAISALEVKISYALQ